VLTWGWGERGQLGHGEPKSIFEPKQVKLKLGTFQTATCLSVQAGHKSTFALLDCRKVLLWGSCGKTQRQLTPVEYNDPDDEIYFCKIMFKPVKLMTTWSKTMSICSFLMADLRYLPAGKSQSWLESVLKLAAKDMPAHDSTIFVTKDAPLNFSKDSQTKGPSSRLKPHASKLASTHTSIEDYTNDNKVDDSIQVLSMQAPPRHNFPEDQEFQMKENMPLNLDKPVVQITKLVEKETSFILYPEKVYTKRQNPRKDDYWAELASLSSNFQEKTLNKNPAYDMLYNERGPLVADSKIRRQEEPIITSFTRKIAQPVAKNTQKERPVKYDFISESESMSNYSGRQSSDQISGSFNSPIIPLKLKIEDFSQSSGHAGFETPSEAELKIAKLKEYKQKLDGIKVKVMALCQVPSSQRSKKEEDFLKRAREAIRTGNLDLVYPS
jgi:hypothetical protein